MMKSLLPLFLCLILLTASGCSKSQTMNCANENYIKSNFYNDSNKMTNKQRNIISIYTKDDWNKKYLKTSFSYKEVFTEYFYCNICCNSSNNKIISYSGNEYLFDTSLSINDFAIELIDLIGSMSLGRQEEEVFTDSIRQVK